MVMGHEAAGTVLQLGDGVKHLNVGRFLVDLVESNLGLVMRKSVFGFQTK